MEGMQNALERVRLPIVAFGDIASTSAIPADGLIINDLLALWPSIVLYDRSARHPIAYDSLCMRA
jgi:hypothetical protein